MIRPPLTLAFAGCLVLLLAARSASAAPFTYDPPGKLAPGSGSGRVDANVYAPGIRFPIETGPAYANSQVWGNGGGSGPDNTSQCDQENFSYPWRDNYCETRSWTMPLCPGDVGHQGQDIRAATCKKGVHWAVAVADGTITSIGSYSVYLTTPDGTRFDYLHMQDVEVSVGQKVKRGDHMGKVSNQFGGESTTVHLHFNIRQNVAGLGMVYVPPYLSLVAAYETLIGEPATNDAGTRDAGKDAFADPADKDAAPADAARTEQGSEVPPAGDEPDSSEDGCMCTLAHGGDARFPFGLMGFLAALGMLAARRRS